jgi:glycerophosphoryl diester phosphodiesterase
MMYKYFKIFWIVLLAGCSSQKDDSELFSLEIAPDQQVQHFSAEAGLNWLTVTANCPIEVSSSREWCTPFMIPNYTTGNLRITVERNASPEARTATVSVSSTKVNQIINITVHQAGITPVVEVNKTAVELQDEALDFTLDVTANVPVVFVKPAWIAEKPGNTWKSGIKEYAFTAATMPAGTSFREGDVTVRTVETFAGVPPIPVHVTQTTVRRTRIIAHRGYWYKQGAAQNSLASLRNAIELGVYGSELDVWITTDNVLVLNHDATYGGVNIENSPYSAIEPLRLSNDEPLPTLQQCIDVAKQQTQPEKTKLIIEIKTHSNNANNKKCVDAVVKMVNDSQAADLVDYIAFSAYVCGELIKSNPQHRVAYLDGNLTPASLKSAGYWGLDYEQGVLKSNTAWISQAKAAGLTTNVWTVNADADMQHFINTGVDFITTDYPHTLKEKLKTIAN